VIVGVPKEIYPGERRVALVPMVVPNLVKAGFEVLVQAGAGASAGYPDEQYAEKGAKIAPDRATVFASADIITQILAYGSNDLNGAEDVPLLRREQALIGFLRPFGTRETVTSIADRGVTSFSIELMPRTTRAQSMDALSSMATISGYKAVLLAADVTTLSKATLTSGRGMGLASVADRVRELGGNIAVKSHKGKGTQIRVSLPLTTGAPIRTEPVPASSRNVA